MASKKTAASTRRKPVARSSSRRPLGWVIFLVVLLVVETVWLGAFMISTRSILPPGLARRSGGVVDGAGEAIQSVLPSSPERRDDERIEDLLKREGSKGPGGR